MPLGMPLTALVGAHYLGSLLTGSSGEIHAAAAGLLLLAILLNYRGIELSGRSQVLVVSTILFILGFTVISSAPSMRTSAFVPLFTQGWFSVGQAMALLFFAFMGWEMIGHLAEEFKDPRRDLPLSLGLAFLFVNLLYFAVALVTVGTEIYKTGNPVTAMITLVSFRWGELAGLFVGVLGYIVCYCPIHTFIAGFSRLVYSQSREGHFPEVFGRLHPRFQTPHIALLSFIPLFLGILGAELLLFLELETSDRNSQYDILGGLYHRHGFGGPHFNQQGGEGGCRIERRIIWIRSFLCRMVYAFSCCSYPCIYL